MATGFPSTTTFNSWEIPSEPVKRFTVEEYFQLLKSGVLNEDSPYELIEGWLLHKMARGRLHEFVLDYLNEIIGAALRPHSDRWRLRSQSALVLSDGVPEPDVCVLRGPRERYLDRLPEGGDAELVIEISDTTLARDRGYKLRSYARAGIPEYWIVNTEERQVEVYTAPQPVGSYDPPRIVRFDEAISLTLQGERLLEIQVRLLFQAN
jgi:Uma2 family endonuclease